MKPRVRWTKLFLLKFFGLLLAIIILLRFDLYISSKAHCTLDLYYLEYHCTVDRDEDALQPEVGF